MSTQRTRTLSDSEFEELLNQDDLPCGSVWGFVNLQDRGNFYQCRDHGYQCACLRAPYTDRFKGIKKAGSITLGLSTIRAAVAPKQLSSTASPRVVKRVNGKNVPLQTKKST